MVLGFFDFGCFGKSFGIYMYSCFALNDLQAVKSTF